ncbi:MAG: hypothetical protein JRJ80_21120 [Deltaproteobacteria bacterium]|nr:hypothetical protein [Deltaproteobacteria bacterium]
MIRGPKLGRFVVGLGRQGVLDDQCALADGCGGVVAFVGFRHHHDLVSAYRERIVDFILETNGDLAAVVARQIAHGMEVDGVRIGAAVFTLDREGPGAKPLVLGEIFSVRGLDAQWGERSWGRADRGVAGASDGQNEGA